MSTTTQKITLQYEGKAYRVEVKEKIPAPTVGYAPTETDHEYILGDVYEDETTSKDNVALEALNDPDSDPEVVPTEAPPELTISNSCSTIEEENSNADLRWSREVTVLLIVERGRRNDHFEKCVVAKRKLWDQIARKINLVSKTSYTGTQCCDKWRSLLQRYRLIKAKMRYPGHKPITWSYFRTIDAYLGHQAVVHPRTGRPLMCTLKARQEFSTRHRFRHLIAKKISDTLPNHDAKNDTPSISRNPHFFRLGFDSSSKLDSPSRLDSSSRFDSSSKFDSDDPPWLDKYLSQRKEEEERRIVWEEKRLDEERKRWQEQRSLEERKLAALNALNESVVRLLDRLK